MTDTARQLMSEAADFAIYDMLQRIMQHTDRRGNLDFNGVIREVVPMAIAQFISKCPEADLLAMSRDARAFRAQIEAEYPDEGNTDA